MTPPLDPELARLDEQYHQLHEALTRGHIALPDAMDALGRMTASDGAGNIWGFAPDGNFTCQPPGGVPQPADPASFVPLASPRPTFPAWGPGPATAPASDIDHWPPPSSPSVFPHPEDLSASPDPGPGPDWSQPPGGGTGWSTPPAPGPGPTPYPPVDGPGSGGWADDAGWDGSPPEAPKKKGSLRDRFARTPSGPPPNHQLPGWPAATTAKGSSAGALGWISAHRKAVVVGGIVVVVVILAAIGSKSHAPRSSSTATTTSGLSGPPITSAPTTTPATSAPTTSPTTTPPTTTPPTTTPLTPPASRVTTVLTALAGGDPTQTAPLVKSSSTPAEAALETAPFSGYATQHLTITPATATATKSGATQVWTLTSPSGAIYARTTVTWVDDGGTWYLATWPVFRAP